MEELTLKLSGKGHITVIGTAAALNLLNRLIVEVVNSPDPKLDVVRATNQRTGQVIEVQLLRPERV